MIVRHRGRRWKFLLDYIIHAGVANLVTLLDIVYWKIIIIVLKKC